MKPSPIAKRVLEAMVPGVRYHPVELAMILGITSNFAHMQMVRMSARGHLDRHQIAKCRFEYSLPGTLKTSLPPSPPRRFPPSNLGQVIGRLLLAAEQ